MSLQLSEQAAELLLRDIAEAEERDLCASHPAFLLDRVQAVDAKTGERFQFQLIDPDAGWYWQREVLDWWLGNAMTVVLKARQLGITWLAAGYGLWLLLFKPGTRVLVISINEEEASKVVNRLWDMLESLPSHLRNGVEVIKPTRGVRPHTAIELRHRNGQISAVLGLPSTKKAGHGETAALVILDEFARQDYARETWKAVLPTMSGGGTIAVISTANGVSNDITGEGNFYHHIWTHADEYGISKEFLRWDLHPDRDEAWYREFAMALPPKDRAEQFPADELEAFILTGDQYFDAEALAWYAKNAVAEPLYRFNFLRTAPDRARKEKRNDGWIRLYEEPKTGAQYGLAVDVATGRGTDYSAAYVVDLSTMALSAEFHAKCDADIYAFNLHYLGRYYNTARIAVEMGGGYGEAPTAFLRDGKEGRPPYPKLYRHRQASRADLAEHKPFGFPMNSKTRPLVLEGLERALRERTIPAIPHGLLTELQTFVHARTNPTPRAQDGCNDDRVMAAAIAMELFRQFGEHPDRPRRKPRRPVHAYPWQDKGESYDDDRYRKG